MVSPATSEEATPLVVLMEIVRGVEGRPGLAEVVLRLQQTHRKDLIRVEPTHWHLLQPNWPSDVVGMR